MANFTGHLTTAAAAGVVAGGLGWYAGVLGPDQAMTCFFLAAIGGLSPDIDSDNSHSIRVLFNMLSGAILVTCTALGYAYHGIVAALVLRYGLIWPFRWYSVHRGVWHSVPMGWALSMAVYCLGDYLGDPAAAWYARFFALGFIIHLIVDEIVGFGKRSQWTALKFWESKSPFTYVMLYLFSGGALVYLNT